MKLKKKHPLKRVFFYVAQTKQLGPNGVYLTPF